MELIIIKLYGTGTDWLTGWLVCWLVGHSLPIIQHDWRIRRFSVYLLKGGHLNYCVSGPGLEEEE